MDAKDTAMTPRQVDMRIMEGQRTFQIVNEQAEVSFKTGYDKAMAQLANMTEECKQMGRREVVEWVETGFSETLEDIKKRWTEKKKEWGIKC